MGFVLLILEHRNRRLPAVSSKAIKPRRGMEQSMTVELDAVHVLFALFFFEPVDLQFFF